MSFESPDVDLKTRVYGLLAKAQDRLTYLESFNQTAKKAELDKFGNQATDDMRASYQNVETGKAILKAIIKDLGFAKEALEIGSLNVSPIERVEDVLQKTEKTWVREFEVPERLPDESAEDALRRHLRKNP